MKKTAGFALLVIFLAAALPAQKTDISVPLRFDHYYSLEQVTAALQALNKAYPGLTSLDAVGKSDEGRPLYAMTVNNPKTGPALEKPAVYVDGNIHGNEIQGGEISLYLLD
ncbi:MAG: M14 family zinc carboxypeptidase, partial [Candidatus Aminicenantes bacterium]